MGLYSRYVLPRLIDLAMSRAADAAERAKLVPRAAGEVLEVGIGSALNAPFYGPAVRRLYAIDPSLPLWRLGAKRRRRAPLPIRFVAASAEAIPLGSEVVDTVITTWTLCSIPDAEAALGEMHRVLRPGGRLLFVEHGRAPDARVAAWQDRLTPLWRTLAGGCHMNRPIDTLIQRAGFRLAWTERGYAEGPRVLAYLYRGVAEPVAS